MFTIKFMHVFIFGLILQISYAQRRIHQGKPVTVDHRFVVYLVKAPVSPKKYDTWTCGGALVSEELIVTSAACVEDVQHLYAIAGYKKYVSYDMMQMDPCTREKKKKIVFICVPKNYDLVFERVEKWSNIDIAVVKVESPYDFNDGGYVRLCSYTPTIIPINYEDKYQEAGVDTLVFGWGHKLVWRNPQDATNYNEEMLHYASSTILEQGECLKQYRPFRGMSVVIDRYMICTLNAGNLNDAGEPIKKVKPPQTDGCVTKAQRMSGMIGVPCESDEDVVYDQTRRETMDLNLTLPTRRHGICQNDHGGPLITWQGSREILIGVASMFIVNEESECTGPYLFTSTKCNAAFLDCIVNGNGKSRRTSCDLPFERKGYNSIVERHVSWADHPDGPADNEMYRTPQNNYNRFQNMERQGPGLQNPEAQGVFSPTEDERQPVEQQQFDRLPDGEVPPMVEQQDYRPPDTEVLPMEQEQYGGPTADEKPSSMEQFDMFL